MTLAPLLVALALLQGGDSWKTKNVTIVVQHSGAHRAMNATITSMLNRILATRPETAEAAIIGFDRDFEQLDGNRFKRTAAVLQERTADADALTEAVAGMVFHGPSPIYDALILALDAKPERILLVSNGIDNASKASFDDVLASAEKAKVPVTTLYLAADPTAGGDSRLKKLAKNTGGRFIDIRLRDSWDQLMGSLR
jgi:hypothetical protein